MNQSLDSKQVTRLVRLVMEAREVEAQARGRHVIEGLARLIGAIAGGCVTDVDFWPMGRGSMTPVALHGWDDTTLPSLQIIAERGSVFHPLLATMMQRVAAEPGSVLTVSRSATIGERAWMSSEFADAYARPAHLGDALFSGRRTDHPHVLQGLGFYRGAGDPPFGEAERSIIELFHGECWRLLCPPGVPALAALRAKLSPRERQTLELLLAGSSDKEIAARLEISPHTVNQYNKSIFRRFGVGSRTSLVARVLGDERGVALPGTSKSP